MQEGVGIASVVQDIGGSGIASVVTLYSFRFEFVSSFALSFASLFASSFTFVSFILYSDVIL